MKTLSLLLVLFVVLALAGCSVQCGTPSVEEEETTAVAPVPGAPQPTADTGPKVVMLQTGDKYDEENKEITSKTAEFTPETEAMHVSADISGLKEGQKITGKLIAVDVTSSEGEKITDTEVLATDITAPSEETNAHFTFSAPTAGWPRGSYKVLILVEEAEIDAVDLTVK